MIGVDGALVEASFDPRQLTREFRAIDEAEAAEPERDHKSEKAQVATGKHDPTTLSFRVISNARFLRVRRHVAP